MNYMMPHSPKESIKLTDEGILKSKKFLLKDMCDVKGLKCSCGNPDFYNKCKPAKDYAPFLKQILLSGASLEGITICDEFFYSVIGENKHYGTPLNNAAKGCVPGGSSSGSAAALTQDNFDFTIGSDTGGSVRVPASFCGLIGIRPTHARINTENVYPMSPSFDTIGWFSKDIEIFKKIGNIFFKNFKKTTINKIVIAGDLVDLAENDLKFEFESYCQSKFKSLDKVEISKFKKSDIANNFRIIQAYEIKSSILPWILKNKPRISSEINSRFDMVKNITKDEYSLACQFRKEFILDLDKRLPNDVYAIFPTVPFSAPKCKIDNNTLGEIRKKIMMMTSIAGMSSRPQVTLPKLKHKSNPVGISILGSRNSDEVILSNLELF